MNILLIGNTGQVGWELQRTLAPLGTITAIDYPNINLADTDNTRAWVRRVRPNVIVNAAAYTAVDKAETDLVTAHAINAYVKDRPGHDRRYDIDITKIKTELGWHPTESLATGLLKTVQWYLDHAAWVDAIRANPEYRAWMERNYAKR